MLQYSTEDYYNMEKNFNNKKKNEFISVKTNFFLVYFE
jgi:hypothetical protein